MVDLLLAGDFYAPQTPFPEVDSAVRDVIGAARFSFLNLEAPVTPSTYRITKTGPAIASHPDALAHVASLGFTGVVTANNHILDAGQHGLADTLDACASVGLLHVGSVSESRGPEAGRHLDLQLADGSTVRLLAYCEREWSVTSGDSAVGWSVVDAVRDLSTAKALGMRVVVVLHGGNEFFPLPRPRLRDELRLLAELGADAIVMHHNHVPSAYEIWNGSPICYGLGNFQFAMSNPNLGWHEGLLAGLTFTDTGAELELTPVIMGDAYDVSIPDEDRTRRILNQVEGHRLQVGSDVALRAQWQEFVERTGRRLLEASLPGGPSQVARAVKRVRMNRAANSPEQLLVLANVLRRDSLADAVESYLRMLTDDEVGWAGDSSQ